MQDEQRLTQQNDEQVVSPSLRNQRVLEYLEDLWKRPHMPSQEDLKRISEFVVSLPEEYRSVGLTTIANHFVNNMSLHMLELMATFQQKAEQEGISSRECKKTFDKTLPKAFQVLAALNTQASVQSLDSLVALSNITIALYTLSWSDSAEEAQSLLYELPTMYYERLTQENLVVKDHKSAPDDSATAQPSKSSDWSSYQPMQGYIIPERGMTEVTIPTQKVSSSSPVPVETGKILFMPAA